MSGKGGSARWTLGGYVVQRIGRTRGDVVNRGVGVGAGRALAGTFGSPLTILVRSVRVFLTEAATSGSPCAMFTEYCRRRGKVNATASTAPVGASSGLELWPLGGDSAAYVIRRGRRGARVTGGGGIREWVGEMGGKAGGSTRGDRA